MAAAEVPDEPLGVVFVPFPLFELFDGAVCPVCWVLGAAGVPQTECPTRAPTRPDMARQKTTTRATTLFPFFFGEEGCGARGAPQGVCPPGGGHEGGLPQAPGYPGTEPCGAAPGYPAGEYPGGGNTGAGGIWPPEGGMPTFGCGLPKGAGHEGALPEGGVPGPAPNVAAADWLGAVRGTSSARGCEPEGSEPEGSDHIAA
jgi:hypothetical protein